MDLPIFDKYTNVYPNEYDGLQPRLGVAYNFAKNTVLRIDGGLFIGKTDGTNLKNVFSGGPSKYGQLHQFSHSNRTCAVTPT